MAIKSYKPTSPGMRSKTSIDRSPLSSKSAAPRKLFKPLKKKAGRNVNGRITMRRRGGGHKRKFRVIEFRRTKLDVPAKVAGLEYDPNRTAWIALLHYVDGAKSYILAPEGLKPGDMVMAGKDADIKPGNCMPLVNMPLGTIVHNIEMKVGKGAQIARSAGTNAQLMAREGGYALIKMPSGEIRRIKEECTACIGQVGNIDHENISLGKAGRSRWLGRRPKVRGVAMNPVDHPLGGGEGKSAGGRHPCSPWGMPAKGFKTRKRNKASNKYIVKKRSKK